MTQQEFKDDLDTKLNVCYFIIEEAKSKGLIGTSIYVQNGDFLAPMVGELREQFYVDVLQVGKFKDVGGVELLVTWGK